MGAAFLMLDVLFRSGGEAAAVCSLSGVRGGAASFSAQRHRSGETQPLSGSEHPADEAAGCSQQGLY